MPFKANAARRHHIPKQRYRVRNWLEYDAALRARGSLTVWFSDEAVERWRAETRSTPGGQRTYSDLAILTALTLRAVYRLALRQTEGLVASLVQLLGLDLAVPDHSTLSRRAKTVTVLAPLATANDPVRLLVDSTGVKLCGPGDWLVEKHATRRRRAWRKLHIGLDAVTGRIVAATLTDHDVDDASQVGPLLDQSAEPLEAVIADGAYEQSGVYEAMNERHPGAAVVVPPRSTAVPSDTAQSDPTPRDRHLQAIADGGRRAWQATSGYNLRALVEAFFSRYKHVIGDGLRFHTDDRQQTEIGVAALVLNRMLDLGRPDSVRIA
ncbi:IS5 family transposase [Azospirillum brasilense]|uniref:IS5/IS1182 family transposase n=1 Tax=Azospirillum brasilense TaxID=192 RepID=A0A235HDS4_AZOBR|nr:IS5 family transposase [Azospirillum brasilense]OYD83888.1 IS5/IS1182 family transposase [Azospirillum brasilense]